MCYGSSCKRSIVRLTLGFPSRRRQACIFWSPAARCPALARRAGRHRTPASRSPGRRPLDPHPGQPAGGPGHRRPFRRPGRLGVTFDKNLGDPMTEHDAMTASTRTVRFHDYGEPADVLRLETIPVPVPGAGRIRVAVHACGLNPADWALCRGLFAGDLPRGIGIDVSGTVDAVGAGVTGVV